MNRAQRREKGLYGSKLKKIGLQFFAESQDLSIFDLVTAPEITAYWETFTKDDPPYLGETLWTNQSKLGLDLKWIKGSSGQPVVLKPSAFDAGVVPRPRIGFDTLSAQMPFFKESTYIDEELRQQLNMVLETGNQAYIDSVANRVFDDETRLLKGARARREMMRMMALTTGSIAIIANGQAYNYDYGVPDNHKETVTVSWSDPTADILSDIRTWQDTVENDTGVRPTRAVCDQKTWLSIKRNEAISKAVYVISGGGVLVSDNRVKSLLVEELGLEVVVNSKMYIGDNGIPVKYVPENTFVLFPSGQLGYTWFGTTPEQSDLMSGKVANVSITDTGVAVTTMPKTDPVNVETKVSMICMPSFEAADNIFIADVSKE